MSKLFEKILAAPTPVWGAFMTACGYGLAMMALHPEYYVPAIFFM